MGQHYHFIGIGGIGMGAIAHLMIAQGHQVSGSDVKENDMTTKLRGEGVKIYIGHQEHNIAGADFVVFSSAISEDNPEMKAAKTQHKNILQRAQLLAELMKGQIGITIAGAHGKTTTTSMVSSLLMKAGLNPTAAIGGILNGSTWQASMGQGKYFVAEVDESDGSFLYFHPKYSIVTNIDFEHVDYYHNWENILKAYKQFIQQSQPDGTVILCGDDLRLRQVASEANRNCLTYGLTTQNEIFARAINLEGYTSHFNCIYQGKDLGRFKLIVPGSHNVTNALACIGLGLELSIELNVVRDALKEFRGVRRRFQVKGHLNDIIVVDDYGHHPTEIRATLETAKSLKRPRLITVFQPHRYTRTKYLLEDFVKNLTLSDYLIITDIYSASEKPIEGVSAENLYQRIKDLKSPPVVYLKKEEIIPHLLDMVRPGDLVLTLGAGDITNISDELVKKLTQSYQPTQTRSIK